MIFLIFSYVHVLLVINESASLVRLCACMCMCVCVCVCVCTFLYTSALCESPREGKNEKWEWVGRWGADKSSSDKSSPIMFCVCHAGNREPFMIHDNGSEAQSQVTVFVCHQDLELLSRFSTWYMDEIFAAVPRIYTGLPLMRRCASLMHYSPKWCTITMVNTSTWCTIKVHRNFNVW